MKTPIWTIYPTLEKINESLKHTLASHLKIVFVEIGDSHLSARMPIEQEHLQSHGIMHGGASAVLAETVASIGATYCIKPEARACVGIELNINHLRAIKEGHLVAKALPLHIGNTTQVWEIKIYNTSYDLVSAARLTLAVIT